MLQQGRRRAERRSNGLDGRDGLRIWWLQGGDVLQREEGAESAGERLGFGCEDFAQGGDFAGMLGDGHGYVWWIERSGDLGLLLSRRSD